jgi:hypothetical protein
MDTIVLTTCSANHLAQAKNMCDSVLRFNPRYRCIIGLVDKVAGRFDVQRFSPHTILEADSIGLEIFDEMKDRYNLFELNCAMKSYFVTHVLETFRPSSVIYLDSDIMVFHPLNVIEEELQTSSFLVTPHTVSLYPPDGLLPGDRDLLRTGIYNAGFYALKNDENARRVLNWLNLKMVHHCYDNPSEGLFVDQKWFNLVPGYFEGVKALLHPGCNAAYWNLHERSVEKRGDEFYVNGKPLVFFHFSGYSLDLPAQVSRHQGRIGMEKMPALVELFRIYHNSLESSGHRQMLSIPYAWKKESFTKKLKRMLRGK